MFSLFFFFILLINCNCFRPLGYGVSYYSPNQWCLLVTISTSKDKCTGSSVNWATYFWDWNRDFGTYVDLSKQFNRCPTCKMQLTVDGEASLKDDIFLVGSTERTAQWITRRKNVPNWSAQASSLMHD